LINEGWKLRLGPLLTALEVVVGPGGAATLITAIVGWIKYRTSKVKISVKQGGIQVLVEIDRTALASEDIHRLLDRVAEFFHGDEN
jgi:Effector Associated Constant Component 1